MKHKTWAHLLAVLGLTLALSSGVAVSGRQTLAQDTVAAGAASPQAAVGAAFTYQGRLTDAGNPADGSYDFEFTLYDDPSTGSQVGSAITVEDQAVDDGLFTVRLDFGAVFAGDARYLAIGVRPGGSTGAYTALSPRQEITAAPYALYALDVAAHDHWGETWTGAGTGLTLSGGTTGLSASGATGVSGSSSSGYGVVGSSTSGYGVYGSSTSGYGVYGSSSSTLASVYGSNTSSGPGVRGASSSGPGVSGSTSSSTEAGVYGSNTSGSGVRGESTSSHGVHGSSTNGYGVYGASVNSDGVYGATSSSTSAGVYGQGSSGYGVAGRTSSGAGYAGVSGWNYGAGDGVSGMSTGGVGVYGTTANTKPAIWGNQTAGAAGVWGVSVSGPGVSGQTASGANAGVVGNNTGSGPGVSGTSTSGNGIYGSSGSGHGVSGATANSTNAGVYGSNTSSGPGVKGESTSGRGVYGFSASSTGVRGESTFGYGIYGSSVASDLAGVGGENYGDGYGVWGYSAAGWGGYFWPSLWVNGYLAKGGGSFKIDHPLDPEHKYLYHSFVESPDMMNVYNGNVILDEKGEAWVELPAWFEALNRDFRYQLTPIGAPGPNLHIAEEVAANRFKIAGGTAGGKVSWQVTGIRQDPYAEANRIPVEETKPPKEQGTYLHPAAYGQPASKGLDYREAAGGGE